MKNEMTVRPRRPPRAATSPSTSGGDADRSERVVGLGEGDSDGNGEGEGRTSPYANVWSLNSAKLLGAGGRPPHRRRRRRCPVAVAAVVAFVRRLIASCCRGGGDTARRRLGLSQPTYLVHPAAAAAALLSLPVALLVFLSAIRSTSEERALRNYLSASSGFRPHRHPSSREERFPSVEERVRMYTGDWHRVPCDGDGTVEFSYAHGKDEGRSADAGAADDASPLTIEYFHHAGSNEPEPGSEGHGGTSASTSTLTLQSRIRPDTVFRVTPSRLSDCALRPYRAFLSLYVKHGLFRPLFGPSPDYGLEMRSNMRSYCVDSADFGVISGWLYRGDIVGGGDGDRDDDDDDDGKLSRWAEVQSDRGIGAVLKRAARRRLGGRNSDDSRRRVRQREARGEPGGAGNDAPPPPIVAQFGDHPVPVIARTLPSSSSSSALPDASAVGQGEEARSEDSLPFPIFMKFRPATGAFVPDRLRQAVTSESPERDIRAAVTTGDGNGVAKDTVSNDVDDTCLSDPTLRPRLVYPPSPSSSSENLVRYGPVLWRLESHRHYNFLRHVPYWDTAWEDKLDAAVWRGVLTGFDHRKLDALSLEERARLTDGDICMEYSERCRLVLSAAKQMNESGKAPVVVDAGLTFLAPQGSVGYQLPEIIDGVSLLKSSMSIRQLLRYRVLISLQGNDVASGLKWSLFSRSVVLMPPPTVNSWAMEETLLPWVHYVPLSKGVDDVEDMVRWITENEERARTIAERATLWVWDMFFHEDAAVDEMKIKEEVLRRYGRYFRHSTARQGGRSQVIGFEVE